MKMRAHPQWRTVFQIGSAGFFVSLLVCALALPAPTNQTKAHSSARLSLPNGLASDNDENLFISDLGTHRIVKRDVRGRLTVIAGTGEAGFSGDGGLATKAQLHAPHDLLFDADGNLLIADTGNQRIRKIDRRGIITTIAGDGKALQSNYNGAVPATSLNNPQSLALDREGNLLIADTFNHVIRKLDRSGKLAIFAGSVAGFGGDGGDATKAQMNLPMAVTVAPDGSIYVSDAGNSRIRQITPDGKIKTIAGFGPAADTYGGGYAGDGGPAEKAKLFSATDIKCNAAGDLYIVDSGNHRLRVIRKGVINTLAGNGQQGFSGDGKAAAAAEMNTPQKIALTNDGTLFISERANHRVRKIDRNGVIVTILQGTSSD
jgi:DNA-binding beta-propeller fold protein YncE